MAEATENYKKKRASLKAKLTIFANYIKKLDNELTPDTNLNDLQIFQLEERFTKIKQVFNEFDELQTNIECSLDNAEAEYKEREVFQELYYSIYAQAKSMLTEASKISDNNVSDIDTVGSRRKVLSVKLPTIDLPKFNGQYHCWLEFRDTFSSLIHTNNDINEIQKFHYLRASLVEGAAEVICSIEFSAANYKVAWDILCNRFNNPRLLVNNHVKAIFNLDAIFKESSVKMRKLIDSYSKHLRSLEQLGQPTIYWDTLIIFIITSKLDPVTIREWEEYKIEKEVPTLEQLTKFLKGRADLLETIECTDNKRIFHKPNAQHLTTKGLQASFVVSCTYCKKPHFIYNCPEFINLTVKEKCENVKKLKLCNNCLKTGHYSSKCNFGPCRKCSAKHNTLLHAESMETETKTDQVASTSLSATNIESGQVLLSTALIKIHDHSGRTHIINALLDSGSQSSFLTLDLCNKLKLRKEKTDISVSGLNNAISVLQFKCGVTIESCINAYKTNLSCYVINEITNNVPGKKIDISNLAIPLNIKLANPTFYKPKKIDILIGADLFWNLICIGQIRLGPYLPTLQKTRFGWIVSGPVGNQVPNQVSCHVSKLYDLEKQLARFWEIEECPHTKLFSAEETACETYFKDTLQRANDGRFIVKIPLKDSVERMGESKALAIKRFGRLENKFKTNEVLKTSYIEVMNEYQIMGHMTNVTDQVQPPFTYYMPHHAVIREDAKTTKLRVVFDASAPTSTGISFNQIQMVGPTMQDNIISILLRFRKHSIVVSADIKKMYRQVLVHESQRPLQRIIWRTDPNEALQTFQLNTVTFGTAAAPYLAIRCLFELASEYKSINPVISDIIEHDFYVDDLLSGADTPEEATDICMTVSKILKGGCLELHKWQSNDTNVIKSVSNGEEINVVDFSSDTNSKILGLVWLSDKDLLKYNIKTKTNCNRVTKRSILSSTSQIFDPLGLLSPCIIIAKIIMQKLWSEKISWDEAIPMEIQEVWNKFKTELELLNLLSIERHAICKNPIWVELHGFADASQSAYGCCIYLKSINMNGSVFVNLLCAKSKVSPLKSLTIPRLELCGALTLARLTKTVIESLKIKFDNCTFWTDSSIVLGWLRHEPNTLTTFVSNRIAEIQDITSEYSWRHVPSKDNPADLLSRGVNPAFLINCEMWWHGPEWLHGDKNGFPNLLDNTENLPEIKKQKVVSLLGVVDNMIDFDRFSNLNRIKRTIAYVLRFIKNCRSGKTRQLGLLTVNEIYEGFQVLIKISQMESFQSEFETFKKIDIVNKKSKLIGLNPFIDSNRIIRVGGRLKNSEFDYNKKHPVVLCAKHRLTKLIFAYEHRRLMHCGPQLLLASIREQFWAIGGRNLAKLVVRSCTICFKVNPKQISPIMGNIPESRLRPSAPFEATGTDYAGPFLIKNRKGRGGSLTKCWISLFVCFTTRAIHLELVSSLSSEAFIMALRRFVARRGKPKIIYSDNGTTFVGANKILATFFKENETQIIHQATNDGIIWKFIPPCSPHFGGIWEAGVKSVKYHLKRVMGNASLTFEEFYTLLTQVEAILNSRPLFPISTDPSDLHPITPAHLLMGRSLTTIPYPDIRYLPENRLVRFQRIQQLIQHFWERWSKEFIGELQQRCKWKQTQGQLQQDSLVIVKEDNQPPMHWKLGRIVILHAGADGVSRVASIRTSNGVIKRAFTKICPLPTSEI